MSVNLFSQPEKGYGSEPRCTYFSFAPNGTSAPLTASNYGPPGVRATAVTYGATGVFTLVFPADFQPPSNTTFVVSAQVASLAAYFEAVQLGAYVPSTRTLTVQVKQGATGYAPAVDPNCRVHVGIIFNDSTGV